MQGSKRKAPANRRFPFSQPHKLAPGLWRGCRIGILGGSFNPAHEGHYYISLLALRLFQLDQVWWMVSPQNPLKSKGGMASLEARLSSARRFTDGHPQMLATAIEGEFHTSHTARTLACLHRHFADTQFIWLMGTDNLAQIHAWRDWERIFATTPVAVMTRTSYAMRVLNGKAARRFRQSRVPPARLAAKLAKTMVEVVAAKADRAAWTYVMNFPHPASATAIRKAGGWPIKTGQD